MDLLSELLPCPFCGGNAEVVCKAGYCVQCTRCGASTINCTTEIEAYTKWNIRHYKDAPLLFVEDGSVDLDELRGIPVTPIVYRQRARMPMLVEIKRKESD